jgi:hypothetical protein
MFANVVLDPVGKMTYFKQHWPENLQDDVVSTAEEVVSPKSSFFWLCTIV